MTTVQSGSSLLLTLSTANNGPATRPNLIGGVTYPKMLIPLKTCIPVQSTNAPALSRMGWEEMMPLENDEVTYQDKAINRSGSLNEKQASLLGINDSVLLVEDWKPAEDGNGTILRFLDLGGVARPVTVQMPLLRLTQAVQTDAVERDQQTLPLVGTHGFRFTFIPMRS